MEHPRARSAIWGLLLMITVSVTLAFISAMVKDRSYVECQRWVYLKNNLCPSDFSLKSKFWSKKEIIRYNLSQELEILSRI